VIAKNRYLVEMTMGVVMGLTVVGCGDDDATPMMDSGTLDSGTVDSGAADSGAVDSGGTDAGGMDAGELDSGPVMSSLAVEVSAFVDGMPLDDGQGTHGEMITIQGVTQDELGVAEFSYSWNDAEFEPIAVASDAFEFDLLLIGEENLLVVQAVNTTDETDTISVERTYFRAIAARAGTHDKMCQGNGTAAGCEEVCNDYGGDYDADWGHIGGCRNMPNSVSGDGLDFNDPTLPDVPAQDVTHDQQCLGSTSAAHATACEEICEDIGGAYDSEWGNIGGCRNIPGSGLIDLDFGDGTIEPAPPARDIARDQQCIGSTSSANATACQEICEDIGGTYDGDWGNIGGCRGFPGSATADFDFTRTAPPRREDM
jgi:hypothetical protein